MRLAICIALKNRSYQIVKPDPPGTYDHIRDRIQLTPADLIEPPEMDAEGNIIITPFPTLLRSLARIHRSSDQWTVIVVDYGSTDIDVKHLCELHLGGQIPYAVLTADGSPNFNRGGGLDTAAQVARKLECDTLFFCDADMFFTQRHIFDTAERILKEGSIFYPVCFSYTDPSHQVGYWRDTGYGMVFLRTVDYFLSERWKNNRSWGWEDRKLYESFPPDRIKREWGVGFFHQWHPNSIDFKTKEYEVKTYVKDAAIY
jgi:hypothetical protein